jgi:hypothetical protein
MAKSKKAVPKGKRPQFMVVLREDDVHGLALLHKEWLMREFDRVRDAYVNGDTVKQLEAMMQTTFDGFWEEYFEHREELIEEALKRIAEWEAQKAQEAQQQGGDA